MICIVFQILICMVKLQHLKENGEVRRGIQAAGGHELGHLLVSCYLPSQPQRKIEKLQKKVTMTRQRESERRLAEVR